MGGDSFIANKKGDIHDKLDSNPPSNYDHGIREIAKDGWRSLSEGEFNYSKDEKNKDTYSK